MKHADFRSTCLRVANHDNLRFKDACFPHGSGYPRPKKKRVKWKSVILKRLVAFFYGDCIGERHAELEGGLAFLRATRFAPRGPAGGPWWPSPALPQGILYQRSPKTAHKPKNQSMARGRLLDLEESARATSRFENRRVELRLRDSARGARF